MSVREQIRKARQLKAVTSHPLRARILAQFDEHNGDLSSLDLAQRTGATLGTTAYHVRALADAELLVETRTVQRRGALQHYYRPGDLTALRAAIEEQLAALQRLL